MSRIGRLPRGADFEYVRSAAFDTTGCVTVVQRRVDVPLSGLYEFPGSRVDRQGDVLRPLVMEREMCNKFGLVVCAIADIEPFEGGVGAGKQFFRSYTYQAQIRGGDPVFDESLYQRCIQIDPREALKFSELLTPECCRVMGSLVAGQAQESGLQAVLQPAA